MPVITYVERAGTDHRVEIQKTMIDPMRRTGRSFFLASVAAGVLALGAPLSAHAEPLAGYPEQRVAPKGAPNVLLIMTDDVGFGASSTFGGPIPTPTFDRLAAAGVRFNRFHTTALCSPTRAALLTGRNHHSVGSGSITELATGHPGYNSVIPASAATIGRVLRDNGYSTSWFGKNHNTPDWETGPAGPFERWPTGLGFEHFYGFNGGDTDQYAPALIENTGTVEPPTRDPSYILDKDLADHAVSWLRAQHATSPDKPFLLYLAPGTAHAPHHAPRPWIDRFKGQFDQGWDRMREETFARQKAAGIIPADAELTPRPAEVPAWDAVTPDERRLYARMMEVYAAALAHCDDQIGRVVAELERSGQLQNTIVIYIQGDNGASAEGSLQGSANEAARFNGQPESLPFLLSRIDQLGGPQAFNHYPVGWAWAMNSPFQWTKQVASHLGGTRNGMVMAWPGHIDQPGGVRAQFTHVVDIAPTIYEAIGIKPPKSVDGVSQQPIEGLSLLYALNKPDAPERHTTQYFEMFGNRALYRDGWMAATTPRRAPWVLTAGKIDPADFDWELYDLRGDYSQARNLAAADAKQLTALKAAFEREAEAHNVNPMSASAAERFALSLRPYPLNGRTDLTFFPGEARYPNGAFPDLKNRSWSLKARLTAAGDESGVVITQGGRFGGWGLVVRQGKPAFVYRTTEQPQDLTVIAAGQAIAPGTHEVEVVFDYDGGGPGRGGAITLKVDGGVQAQGRLSRTLPAIFPIEGASIGHDTGTPIVEDIQMPGALGGVERVDILLR